VVEEKEIEMQEQKVFGNYKSKPNEAQKNNYQ